MNKAWSVLLVASAIEVLWVIGLKHSYDFLTWAGTVVAIIASFSLLIYSTTKLPVGTAYAVFTGLGTTGTVIVDILVFGEPFQFMKVFLILVLLAGVMGLKLVTGTKNDKGAVA